MEKLKDRANENRAERNGLDVVFNSLSDATRRDILKRVSKKEMSVCEVALPYDMSLAAVSKHLMVLQKAQLITKRRRGKEQLVRLIPQRMKYADDYLRRYKQMWEERFDRLDKLLESEK